MGDFTMPSLGADMERGTLSEWLVAEGDEVRKGQIVAVIETDKSDVEVEVFESGVVAELLVAPGTEVEVGTPLARIGEAGASTAPPPAVEPQPAVGPAVERGDVIYRGPAILAGASTVPCFGFGVRIYPQVTALQDRFQLRLANVSAPTIVAKLPQVLSGTFFHPRVWDYACTAVTMEVANPSAAQIGGDIVGQRRQLKLRLTSVPAIAGPNRQPDVSVAAIDRADASQCAMVSAF